MAHNIEKKSFVAVSGAITQPLLQRRDFLDFLQESPYCRYKAVLDKFSSHLLGPSNEVSIASLLFQLFDLKG